MLEDGFSSVPIRSSFPWTSGHRVKTRAFAKFPVVSDKAESRGSELAFTSHCAFHKWSVFFFNVCMFQLECKCCVMCSRSWIIDSYCLYVNLGLSGKKGFAIHWVLYYCHMWPGKKKIASQLRISSVCLRCCHLRFAEYDNLNWHYQLLYETCGKNLESEAW